jgi:hypothetical protein
MSKLTKEERLKIIKGTDEQKDWIHVIHMLVKELLDLPRYERHGSYRKDNIADYLAYVEFAAIRGYTSDSLSDTVLHVKLPRGGEWLIEDERKEFSGMVREWRLLLEEEIDARGKIEDEQAAESRRNAL